MSITQVSVDPAYPLGARALHETCIQGDRAGRLLGGLETEGLGGRGRLWPRINGAHTMPSALRLRSRRTAAASPGGLRRLADGELMVLARRDENLDAFEAIYDRHSAVAYSLAYRMCGRRADAEDVVQAAFLLLWQSRDRFDPSRGELRSWLLGIVHNSAIDRLRRMSVHERRRTSSEGIEERLVAPERTEEEAQAHEQAAEVRRALGALPDEQRRVIELAYFDGLTHTQIAAKLEQPVGTIKGRMRLGLQKLHAQLADGGPAPPPTGGQV
jgi:RNA polymerase sigma-70 factor (ECF subfamily)